MRYWKEWKCTAGLTFWHKAEVYMFKEEVCKLIKSRKTKQAYQRSRTFIEQLPDGYFEDKQTDLGTDLDIATFSEYIYAQCILDA